MTRGLGKVNRASFVTSQTHGAHESQAFQSLVQHGMGDHTKTKEAIA